MALVDNTKTTIEMTIYHDNLACVTEAKILSVNVGYMFNEERSLCSGKKC